MAAAKEGSGAMKDWMLTQGEKVQIRQWEVLPTDCIEAAAKAQARKLVGWLLEWCVDDKHIERRFAGKAIFHMTREPRPVRRKNCPECMDGFRKDVGL